MQVACDLRNKTHFTKDLVITNMIIITRWLYINFLTRGLLASIAR